jgi:hypothetical protein
MEVAAYRWGSTPGKDLETLLRQSRHATVDGDVYCESNQNLSFVIPMLRRLYPLARYIWLIRNGMDVVASAYQKQWYTGHSENHDCYEDCPPLEKAWIDGRARADHAGEMSEAEWAAMPRFDKCCWYWGYVNRVIEDDLNTHAAGAFFTLRLEKANEELPALIHWMGFEPQEVPSTSVDNAAKRAIHHWTEWTPEEHAAFDRWCGPVMDRHYAGWRQFVMADSARIFMTPVIRSLNRQAEGAREHGVRLQARAEQAERRLHWIEGHWTFKWYRRLRRLIEDRSGRAK